LLPCGGSEPGEWETGDAQKCFDAAYAGSAKEEGSELLALLAAGLRSDVAHRLRVPSTGLDAEFVESAKRYHRNARVAPEDECFLMERFCSNAFIDAAANCAEQLRPIYAASKLPYFNIRRILRDHHFSVDLKISCHPWTSHRVLGLAPFGSAACW
jgi:hypothetical protein